MATFPPQSVARSPFGQALANVPPVHAIPAGTFVPGTKVQVGQHRVIIDRYLSEGGFAHVYVVTLPRAIDGQEKAVLKRVAVPDKEHLANMRTEVETMKRLRGNTQIVKYIDSHASPLKAGGFEVFLLMEFCQGGGLIDFMNTRLQNRLTEPEILKIFTDVAEGVACMHYLKPPLLHRDLKIENVLISSKDKNRIFKLCDFGSAAPPRPAAKSAAEGRLIEDDVQRHTTLQYRSPEMIDVYRKQPIDEKSDIWALGVFLYKLCYYTTPFEEAGQMAILNASFKYPGYPRFSDELKLLIASMLRENPADRPNIYQVLGKACKMDGRELTIRDIYSERVKSEAKKNETLSKPAVSKTNAGASLVQPPQEASLSIPDIAPMRRGRPSAPVSQHNSARPSPSPLRMIESSDPFAQLDSSKQANNDELSHKFPTLDQFSLMTDKSSKFAFQPEKGQSNKRADNDLSERVTAALADEAFVRSPSPVKQKPNVAVKPIIANGTQVPTSKNSTQPNGMNSKPGPPPIAIKKSTMVSTGTMTSLSGPSPSLPLISDRPIHRFPSHEESAESNPLPPRPVARPPIMSTKSGSRLANLLKQDAAKSQGNGDETQTSSSTRPSMEGGRPALKDLGIGVNRSRSLNMRARPMSVNMGAGATHIKDKEIQKPVFNDTLSKSNLQESETVIEDTETSITSDVDFLKAREEEGRDRVRLIRRSSSNSRHNKRASLPSISLAGTKNLLAGRFGDAFKKFEGHVSHNHHHDTDADHIDILTPIASETTELSEDRIGFEETEELSPEMRRELEKRRLEAEERRVAAAAADYKSRVGNRAGPPPISAKAASIQNRVHSLLQDSGRNVTKTATGYGQYTDATTMPPVQSPVKSATFQTPMINQAPQSMPATQDHRSMSAPASAVNLQKLRKPVAPPKPRTLQKAPGGSMPETAATESSNPEREVTNPNEDWESQFSKRYPSLSHLEMVEMDIDHPKTAQVRTKEI